ncbi:MAG: PIN domain-containing protein [Gemmatimonadota bacterium]
MSSAYVDSSVIVAIAFNEARAADWVSRLRTYTDVLSAPLLEAEVRAAARRDHVLVNEEWLSAVQWIIPSRGLQPEIIRVLGAGYVGGADCWHLATALYVANHPSDFDFLTLDARQREVAAHLGFRTPLSPPRREAP